MLVVLIILFTALILFYMMLPLLLAHTVADLPAAPPADDRRESLRLSLKDLDLEHKIGKLSEADYSRLKSELLDEWKDAGEGKP